MTRFGYIMKTFFGGLWNRPLAALGSFLSLFLLFLLFDLAWVASLSAVHYYDRKISKIEIELFLTSEVADSNLPDITEAIERIDGVAGIKYISRETARDRLNSIMGVDLLEGIDENPLPRSFLISFKPDYLNLETLSRFQNDLSRMKGIDEIMLPSQWLEKADLTRRLIDDVLLLLGTLILVAVVLNSIHSVILSARTRLEELIQMQLLGAGPVFLVIPFIMEGIFYALCASAAGWVLMHYGLEMVTFRELDIVMPHLREIIYFCLTAGVVGMVSGYIGIRRSL